MVIAMVSNGGEEDCRHLLKEITAIMADDLDGNSGEEEEVAVRGTGDDHLVAQALFTILDNVRAWLRAKHSALLQATGKVESQLRAEDMKKVNRNREYRQVRLFLQQISDESLTNLSFTTGAYHRSAFHLDQMLAGVPRTEITSLLNSMQKLYARLEEPDLVVGVAALRTEEPSLDSLVLYHQAVGNFQDALCCYERQRSEDDVANYTGMIQCYLSIDQPAAAANLAAGQLEQQLRYINQSIC